MGKIAIILDKFILRFLNDKNYLKIKYRLEMGKKLNLDNPQTFNEKLQWLKLYDRKDIYTTMVDKYEAKKYVANIIGEEYIIPTLGIYDKFDDIDFNSLPNQFVMKCTHDSGGIIICKDKSMFNKKQAEKKINKHLKKNYYNNFREWPYKNVKPRIIVEKYMQDNFTELQDYKFFCFNGKPYMILVCSNRNGNYKNTDFFDTDWKKLNLTRANYQNSKEKIVKPQKLEKMVEIAEKLSQNTHFLRVDLYEINGKVYFGELTFFPSSGFEGFKPEIYDNKLGNLITL